ncbi:MAG: nicotinate (nicotinamide) nucleotide adenylyltransferase [Bacteroidota bacterium]
MKIGLFFGSFNPIHIGHLVIANGILSQTDIQKVWFVVSPQNPLKKDSDLLHAFDRFDLVRKAIDDNPDFAVSDIEFHLPKPSYTIDTLTHLQEKFPQHTFVLIIGEDNLLTFHRWKNYQAILDYFELVVYPRPGTDTPHLKDHPKVTYAKVPLLDISATHIRRCLLEGKSIRYLVTDEVERYIREKKFYL